MLPLFIIKKRKIEQPLQQEYAYIDDVPNIKVKEEEQKKDNDRGVIIIELF